MAVIARDLDVLKFLVAYTHKQHAKEARSALRLALSVAVNECNVSCIDYLINAGADALQRACLLFVITTWCQIAS